MKFPLLAAFVAPALLTGWAQESPGAREAIRAAAPGAVEMEIMAMRKDGPTLPPDQAAQRWVALMDAWLASYATPQPAPGQKPAIHQVIATLPPSSSWEAIAALVKKRHTAAPMQDEALRLLVAILRSDFRTAGRSLDFLCEKMPEPKHPQIVVNAPYLISPQQIARAVDAMEDQDPDIVSDFEKRLAKFEKQTRKPGIWDRSLVVPDLLHFASEKKSAALLLRAFKAGSDRLHIQGRATRRLAAALALKHLDTLQHPVWHLVESLDQAPLYEAMAAKFPTGSHLDRSDADAVYLLALISTNRLEEAAQLIQHAGGPSPLRIAVDELYKMGRPDLPRQMHAFLGGLLQTRPDLSYWDEFIQLAANLNQPQEAMKLLQDSLWAPLTNDQRSEMQGIHYRALLAAGQRDEGVRELTQMIKTGMKDRGEHYDASQQIRWCSDLASLGRLFKRQGLVEEALSLAVQAAEKVPLKSAEKDWAMNDLAELLIEHGSGAKAEKLILGHLAARKTHGVEEGSALLADDLLALLVLHYHKADQPKDVLKVFEKMPGWNATDLTDLKANEPGGQSLEPIAARALAMSGRLGEAHQIIRRLVLTHPANDEGYELMLQFGSAQPMEELLDDLARQNPFEDRPLIWKARLLLDNSKIDAAEQAVRAAIAIDPSDGDQGEGRRASAYTVLADVLDKKGQADEAAKMRRVVTAIRYAEEADHWWDAGLLAEAVRRYEAALAEFDDAYCIQSRLALRHSEMGRTEQGARHYQRAFELMPDSFGRKESHCFGCEGIFKGPVVQAIAEQVLGSRAAQAPVKPQVHYLLGQLREAQGRRAAAADAYLLAVKADPHYFNAWSRLASLAGDPQTQDVLSRESGEHAVLQLLRLSPDTTGQVKHIRNLRRFWDLLLELEKTQPPVENGPLLPLTAAKARIEAGGPHEEDSSSPPEDNITGVRQHLLSIEAVRLASQFLARQGSH